MQLILVASKFSDGWGFAIAVDIDLNKMQQGNFPSYISFLSELKLGKLFLSFTSKTGTYYFDGLSHNLIGSSLQLTGYISLDDSNMSSMMSNSGSTISSQASDSSHGNYLILQASLSASDMMLLLGIEGDISFGTAFCIKLHHLL